MSQQRTLSAQARARLRECLDAHQKHKCRSDMDGYAAGFDWAEQKATAEQLSQLAREVSDYRSALRWCHEGLGGRTEEAFVMGFARGAQDVWRQFTAAG